MNHTTDRPWDWGAIILKGGYWEHIPLFNETTGSVIGSTRRWRGPDTYVLEKHLIPG